MQTLQPWKNFEEFLKAQGLKMTHPRTMVVREALGFKGHFTADDLWIRVQERDRRASKATVYRTLQLLTKSRLVEPRDFEQGRLYYEQMVNHAHHDHLICLECGKITEFENPEIEKLQDEIAMRYHFEIVSHSHKLYGICPRCRTGHSKKEGGKLKIKF